MTETRKHAWFDIGANANSKVWRLPQGLPPAYVCPTCMPPIRIFLREALDYGTLTVDHVPPKSVGGRELVLTCRECNSSAGHELDAELLAREQVLDFADGTLQGEVPVRLELDGLTMRSRFSIEGDKRVIRGIGKANHPDIGEKLASAFRRRIEANKWSDTELTMTFERRFHARRSIVALLRAAFAVFGYRYVATPQLNRVRDQISRPNEVLIPSFGGMEPSADRILRRMMLITEPSEFRSIFVQMARHIVYLPVETDDIYDFLESPKNKIPANIHFGGKDIGWPNGPEHRLDL